MCGLSDVRTRKRLLVEKDLTLTKAIEVATAIEVESRIIAASIEVKPEEVDILMIRNKPHLKCFRCDSDTYLANKCGFKEYKCNKCGIIGHIARACRNKERKKIPRKPEAVECHSSTSSRVIERDIHSDVRNAKSNSDDENEIYLIHTLFSANTPYNVTLGINEHGINFEIDTGSGITIISESTYRRYFHHLPLLPTNASV